MNNKELFEYMKKSQEFSLMEMRLLNEDVKDYVSKQYEPRISKLEHFRTYSQAIVATILFILGIAKMLAIKLKVING